MKRLRIAWFTPEFAYKDQSPAAWASSILVPLLREKIDLDLYTNSHVPTVENEYHYLTARSKHSENPYDLFFYNLEDRIFSQFLRVQCTLIPGIIWFHNYNFTTFGPEPVLNSTWQATLEKFAKPDSKWGDLYSENPQIGPQAMREQAFALVAFCSNPANIPSLENSEFKIFDRQVQFIGLPAESKVTRIKKVSDSKSFSLAYCAKPLIESRTHKLLQALKELQCQTKDMNYQLNWLVAEEEVEQVNKLLAEFELSNVNLTIGRNIANWREVLGQSDAVVNLLYSAYSQLDQYLSESLMFGLPTIMSDFGFSDFLPDDLIFKIQTGRTEVFEIKAVIEKIAHAEVNFENQNLLETATELFSAEMIACELSEFFEAFSPKSREFLAKWNNFQKEAKRSLLQDVQQRHTGATEKLEHILFESVFKELGWLC